MTQEEKELLLEDLCARLPYGVKVLNSTYREPIIQTLFGRVSDDEFSMEETYKQVSGEDYRRVTDDVHYTGYLVSIKPYLRPMSSMTEEEKYYLTTRLGFEMNEDNVLGSSIDNDLNIPLYNNIYDIVNLINWLNGHHFDYHYLIEKELALEAPEGMYI